MNAKPAPFTDHRIALVAAAFGIVYATYVTLKPVLLVVVLAAAVESLSASLHRWLTQRMRQRRGLAAVLLTLGILLWVLIPLLVGSFFVIDKLGGSASNLASNLQKNGADAVIQSAVVHLGPLRQPAEQMIAKVRPQIATALPAIVAKVGALLGGLGRTMVSLGIGLLLFVVALYYFYLNGPRWRDRVVRLLPLPEEDARLFLLRFRQVSMAVLVGNLGTAFIQGATATIGYFIVGVPNALLWGLVTAMSALVPLGTWLVWLPLAIYTAITHAWWRGGFIFVYGVVIVSLIDNMIRPLLTRRGLALHPLLVFLALFGGIAAFGFSGIFIGPLVTVLFITALEVYERHHHKQREA